MRWPKLTRMMILHLHNDEICTHNDMSNHSMISLSKQDPGEAFPNFPINLLLMKAQKLIGSMGTSRGEHIQEMFGMVR